MEVVGEAAGGRDAIVLAEQLQPDVILMDLRMPGLNGIEATRRIHALAPHVGILVVTVYEDDTSVFPAIRAEASGYLLKNADQAELLRAIQTVALGDVIFSLGIAGNVLHFLASPPPRSAPLPLSELTQREREILELIAQGKTNAEIRESLHLSSKTVSNHISNFLFKLQAADEAKLMLMPVEAGLGQRDSDSRGS